MVVSHLHGVIFNPHKNKQKIYNTSQARNFLFLHIYHRLFFNRLHRLEDKIHCSYTGIDTAAT